MFDILLFIINVMVELFDFFFFMPIADLPFTFGQFFLFMWMVSFTLALITGLSISSVFNSANNNAKGVSSFVGRKKREKQTADYRKKQTAYYESRRKK